ncbi:unnamed protein product [Oppiella nova]|uniref:Membrane-bound transcription factor site-2 protease n=1 Tax=Oppiella nova TaxID=334625 RepID=A0A7R9MCF4_9ACAR|nr:unnamed protein product [Oppiella nova]CAG2174816.1 unnamed protein product [Oppiella nova]
MDYNLIVIIAVVWLIINVMNVVLKTWFSYEFAQTLQTLGLTIRPLQIQMCTQSLNRVFYLLSTCRPKLLDKWFTVGTVVTLAAIIPSVYILLQTLYQLLVANYLIGGNRALASGQALYPVIPGINLPMSDFVYYFITLAISSIYHESGHALAGLREGVRLHSFGVFLFIIIPGAFVNLSTEQVLNLNVWNQLKIFTAGVWHNISLALFAIVLLLINPFVLSPLYSQPPGVVVAHIEPLSGAAGPNGLRTADVITGVDDCMIIDTTNWKQCLLSIANHPRDGYCVDAEFIAKEIKSFAPVVSGGQAAGAHCCDKNSENSLCFIKNNSMNERVCLPVRRLLDTSPMTCNTSADCTRSMAKSSDNCVKPVADTNGTKLVRIRRQGKPNVLFWGSPSELYQSIVLVKYKPKLTSLPLICIHYYETLLRYLISFSLALAVFNVIPCVYLDGQWIINASIELTLASRVSTRVKRLVSQVLISMGTVVLSSCVVIGLYQLFDT